MEEEADADVVEGGVGGAANGGVGDEFEYHGRGVVGNAIEIRTIGGRGGGKRKGSQASEAEEGKVGGVGAKLKR